MPRKDMITGILGKKLEQTRIFTEDGRQIPVTKILAGPCSVEQVKSKEIDGYFAIRLGFETKKSKKAGKEIPRFLREIREDEVGNLPADGRGEKLEKGTIIKASDVFRAGDKIQITGISKGKGFAGVVKRWHFAGGPRTHGQSDRERAPGSIGQTTTPGRVYKGKKMAGKMGQVRVTIKGLKVIEVKPEENLLMVDGLVPGTRGGLLVIKKQVA